ncbi:hypothetical protein [Streptomyces sp. NPDC101166]|uniref:hypothetical protein n=1 Tax=Streptomyces sp. NPDC101166 TaxID=3366120 RepID=UPI00380DEACA
MLALLSVVHADAVEGKWRVVLRSRNARDGLEDPDRERPSADIAHLVWVVGHTECASDDSPNG